MCLKLVSQTVDGNIQRDKATPAIIRADAILLIKPLQMYYRQLFSICARLRTLGGGISSLLTSVFSWDFYFCYSTIYEILSVSSLQAQPEQMAHVVGPRSTDPARESADWKIMMFSGISSFYFLNSDSYLL